jgi:hypothetical protein
LRRVGEDLVPRRQTFESGGNHSGGNHKEDARTKSAKVEPNDLQLKDKPPSPQELGEISGSGKSDDPCEGGQAFKGLLTPPMDELSKGSECEVMEVYTLEQISQEKVNPLALDLLCCDPIYCLVSLTLVSFVTGEGVCTELASSSLTPISLRFHG